MDREVKNMEYQKRPAELKIPKLIDRRIRGDMILTYRLVNGEEEIDHDAFFSLEHSHYNLRGNSKKVFKTRAHLNIQWNFFS